VVHTAVLAVGVASVVGVASYSEADGHHIQAQGAASGRWEEELSRLAWACLAWEAYLLAPWAFVEAGVGDPLDLDPWGSLGEVDHLGSLNRVGEDPGRVGNHGEGGLGWEQSREEDDRQVLG
jgi:hypothetical protein